MAEESLVSRRPSLKSLLDDYNSLLCCFSFRRSWFSLLPLGRPAGHYLRDICSLCNTLPHLLLAFLCPSYSVATATKSCLAAL